MENLRRWVALCLMDIFILELGSNRSTVHVKIDGRQETSALVKSGDQCILAYDMHAQEYYLAKLDIVEDTPTNVQSAAPVRIDGR